MFIFEPLFKKNVFQNSCQSFNTIDKYNLFINEDLFIAYDDYDFTYRLSLVEKGYVITDSFITHPNKRMKYNSLIAQFVFNYLRQIPFKEDFRNIKAAKNYMYLVIKYGSSFSKFIKLKLIIRFIKLFNKDLYNRANGLLKSIT